MNEYTMYKSQTNFEQELVRLKAASLSAKTKKQIEDFARIRLAKGSGKLRVGLLVQHIYILSIYK